MKILNVKERTLLEKFVEVEGLDKNVYNIRICDGIIGEIYWDKLYDDGSVTYYSEELSKKIITEKFGVTKKEFLNKIEEISKFEECIENKGVCIMKLPFNLGRVYYDNNKIIRKKI